MMDVMLISELNLFLKQHGRALKDDKSDDSDDKTLSLSPKQLPRRATNRNVPS